MVVLKRQGGKSASPCRAWTAVWNCTNLSPAGLKYLRQIALLTARNNGTKTSDKKKTRHIV